MAICEETMERLDYLLPSILGVMVIRHHVEAVAGDALHWVPVNDWTLQVAQIRIEAAEHLLTGMEFSRLRCRNMH
jgi:hypothetical protein